MVQRKRSEKPGEALRVRVTIPPDGVGVLDYLKGISPAGLNMEILQLVHLGYQFRIAMGRWSLPPSGHLPHAPAAVEASAAPLHISVPTCASQSIQVSAAEHMEEGASVASPLDSKFKSMFGPAYERTRNRKAAA